MTLLSKTDRGLSRALTTIGFFSVVFLLSPLLTHAQATLINIPQASGGFNGYINAIYAAFISLADLLAVVKVIVAGVKYMFSDVVTQKSAAKKDIQGALLGLLIVLAAVLILTVINPNLVNFNPNVQRLNNAPPPPGAPTTAQIAASQGLNITTNNNGVTNTVTVTSNSPTGVTVGQANNLVGSCPVGTQAVIQGNSFTQNQGSVASVSCVSLNNSEVTRLQSALAASGATNPASITDPAFVNQYTSIVAPYSVDPATINGGTHNGQNILFAVDWGAMNLSNSGAQSVQNFCSSISGVTATPDSIPDPSDPTNFLIVCTA